MDPTLKDQTLNLIDKSQSILLLTHAKADCDGLGAMIAMYLTLQSLGKEVVAATNDPAPENLSFLPSINIVQHSIASRNFVITLDLSHTPLNKIKYKLAEDHKSVNIVVTPSEGRFKPEDVSFDHEAGSFDLIITFDTGNLEHLGPIYDQNSELFFKVPVINIDHHASNTDFGKINLVDVVAASTTEVVLGLLEAMEKKYNKKFLDADTATLLLAGLITDTGSFQHANTSPQSMETAARLLDMGARQQEIIKNIYKTKKLSTLKLWGSVLSKVETDPIYKLVWSTITKHDLEESGAASAESESIIDDLLSNAPGAELIMLFKYNDEGYVSVSMRSTTNSVDVGKICQEMGGGGHVRAAGFKRRDNDNLEQLINDTLIKVREYQGKRLNIHPDDAKEIAEKQREKELAKTQPEQAPEATPKKEAEDSAKAPTTVQYLDFKARPAPAPKPETPANEPPAAPQPGSKPKRKRSRKPKPKTTAEPVAATAVKPEAPKEIPPASTTPAPPLQAPPSPPEENKNPNNPTDNVQPTS
ncbi:DHH family phosphoesterase [Candidatus Peregrinibacteria bacterium]|nr:DHH family phosphoesterase [Candidatus Peregrinibacteria bacterium]